MKIHLIWVMVVLIDVNRYSIMCLSLRASQWCTLSKVKIHLIWVMVVLIDDNRYSIMVHPLEGEDTFDMGDGSTDRRQPLQHHGAPSRR